MPRWIILFCSLALLGGGLLSLSQPNLRTIAIIGIVCGALALARAAFAFVRGTPNA